MTFIKLTDKETGLAAYVKKEDIAMVFPVKDSDQSYSAVQTEYGIVHVKEDPETILKKLSSATPIITDIESITIPIDDEASIIVNKSLSNPDKLSIYASSKNEPQTIGTIEVKPSDKDKKEVKVLIWNDPKEKDYTDRFDIAL